MVQQNGLLLKGRLENGMKKNFESFKISY